MDRELLIEIGCEELPAAWLPSLTENLGQSLGASLDAVRLPAAAPIETYSTPRRLTVCIGKIAERQTDLEETITGPPVSAGYDKTGAPTPAAVGFARKQGVDVSALARVETPKGPYLAFHKHERGKAAIDVLPDVLTLTLRGLAFPKQMHWDALLEDGRGELLFGRPIRWLLFLYGGRVVPFVIQRTALAQSPLVQEVRSGAVTYGHRFLATSGRAGRAVKVRSFDDYRARLAEHFVVLDRRERGERILRDLDAHARKLNARVFGGTADSALLLEVPDLVEYPSVVAGFFSEEFLELPAEVLTTTMIHHQHFFPVVDASGALRPAFLAVTNTQPDDERTIARNEERVLAARLRDAQFFWKSDRRTPLEATLPRLETLLFHKKLGTYRAKADRVSALARTIAADVLGAADQADAAARAGLLAKTDLTTEMVRELTELQGTMGGIYAREGGEPERVWKAIYYQYLPQGVERDAPPTKHDLGAAAVTWAAVSLADKLDSVVGLFDAGERPTGSRDPFGLRRQVHGILKILVDLRDLTGIDRELGIGGLLDSAAAGYGRQWTDADAPRTAVVAFFRDRLEYVLEQRGFRKDEVRAVLGPMADASPLTARRRLEALVGLRGSPDFAALAVLFKRVKNIGRELGTAAAVSGDGVELVEPAERALLDDVTAREPRIRAAAASGDYVTAFHEAAALGPAVDRFFTDVFVMVDDPGLRTARLQLVARLRDLILNLADLSEIIPQTES